MGRYDDVPVPEKMYTPEFVRERIRLARGILRDAQKTEMLLVTDAQKYCPHDFRAVEDPSGSHGGGFYCSHCGLHTNKPSRYKQAVN